MRPITSTHGKRTFVSEENGGVCEGEENLAGTFCRGEWGAWEQEMNAAMGGHMQACGLPCPELLAKARQAQQTFLFVADW